MKNIAKFLAISTFDAVKFSFEIYKNEIPAFKVCHRIQ